MARAAKGRCGRLTRLHNSPISTPAHQAAEVALPGDPRDQKGNARFKARVIPRLESRFRPEGGVAEPEGGVKPEPEQTEYRPRGSDQDVLRPTEVEGEGAAPAGSGEQQADIRRNPHPGFDRRTELIEGVHVEEDVGDRGVNQHRREDPVPIALRPPVRWSGRRGSATSP